MDKLFDKNLIAPCGMNCRICLSYFGYVMTGRKRKEACTGCRPRDKSCAFVKKGCEKLTKKTVEYCYECDKLPCDNLEPLNKRYINKYHMSMVENLNYIKEYGMDEFLGKEAEKWKCPECGGVICCHNGICYACGVEKLRVLQEVRSWTGG